MLLVYLYMYMYVCKLYFSSCIPSVGVLNEILSYDSEVNNLHFKLAQYINKNSPVIDHLGNGPIHLKESKPIILARNTKTKIQFLYNLLCVHDCYMYIT